MSAAPSPSRLAELFLDMLASERGAASNTLAAYRRDLDDYLPFLAGRGSTPSAASPDAVRAYMASLDGRGLKPSSAARRLSAVRLVHRFLSGEGYAPADPTAAARGPKKGRALPKTMSMGEVDGMRSNTATARSGCLMVW